MRLMSVLFLLCVSMHSAAGTDGHGGDGVAINGKIYLFDLFENGVHLTPYIDRSQAPIPEVAQQIEQKFFSFRAIMHNNLDQGVTNYSYDDFCRLLSVALSNVMRVNSLLGETVHKSIMHHNWVLSLLDIEDAKDDDGSDIVFDQPLVPIAIRSFRTIKINNKYVSKMDLENLIATVFHEALYGVIKPERVKVIDASGHHWNYLEQRSRRVRESVGSIFAGPLYLEGLHGIAQGSFPSGHYKFYRDKDHDLIYNYRLLWFGMPELSEYFEPATSGSLLRSAKKICEIKNDPYSRVDLRSYVLDFRFENYEGKDSMKQFLETVYDEEIDVLYNIPSTAKNTSTCVAAIDSQVSLLLGNNLENKQ